MNVGGVSARTSRSTDVRETSAAEGPSPSRLSSDPRWTNAPSICTTG